MPAHSKSGHGRRKLHRAVWEQNGVRKDFVHKYHPEKIISPTREKQEDYRFRTADSFGRSYLSSRIRGLYD
ncbi:MAG: hypothetical protein JW754_04435 [Candidatus Aenigmarchaeota archaeon]|nr:hypothetical protein [Candidatus Aenigmarchaeota archaeon]